MGNIKQITRIKPPKYRVGRYVLNEYELRHLMLEVLEKKQEVGIKVKDEVGNIAHILEDGSLSNQLYGIDINSIATLKMLRIRKNNKKS